MTWTSSEDEEVSRVSMVFWWRFVECLENVEPYEFRQGWVDFYEPVVVRLVGAVVKLMEDRSDILEDCLEDCCRLLGFTAVLQEVAKALEQRFGEGDLEGVAAAIHAMGCVGRFVPKDESTILPRAFSLISSPQPYLQR